MPPTDFVLMPYSLWLNVIYWVCLFSATAKCRNIKDLIICDYKDSLINCCNWGIDQNQNSVQFSCSVVSNSLRPHGLQHATPPCPSPTPRVHSDSCPLTRWCHPTISSSMVPFSPRLQSFPASGSFQMSQFFASGCHSLNISPYNEYSGLISFRMDWLNLLAVQETLKSLLQHHSSKASILWRSAFFIVQLSLPYMATGKTIALTRWILLAK